MGKRASRKRDKRKNKKETLILIIGLLLILFLVFSVTRAIVQKGIEKYTKEKPKVTLTIKAKGETVPSKKISFTPTPIIRKTKPKKVATPVFTSTPKKRVTPKKEKVTLNKAYIKEGYYIQVGAFKSEANAKSLVKKINALGYKNITIVKVGGLYKVRVFGFDSKQKALSELEKLKKKGFEGFIGKK